MVISRTKSNGFRVWSAIVIDPYTNNHYNRLNKVLLVAGRPVRVDDDHGDRDDDDDG